MKNIDKNKIPFYIMLILGAYWIIFLYIQTSNPNSAIANDQGAGLLTILSFFVSMGIFLIYALRAIILFLTTGKWFKEQKKE
jgi:hypothetical protein